MSRTGGVQDHEASLHVRWIFRRIKRRFGRVILSARIRARDTKLLVLSEEMNAYNAGSGVVSAKLKELAQLKVAAMVGCPF